MGEGQTGYRVAIAIFDTKTIYLVKFFMKLPMIFSMPTFSVNLGILGSQIIWQKSQKTRWKVTNEMNHSTK